MPKFPDPTKTYTAEPISSKLETAKLKTEPYKPPVSEQSPPSPPPPTKKKPQLSSSSLPPKKSFSKFLPFVFGIVVFLILIFVIIKIVLPYFNSNSSKSETKNVITLTYWGLWEPKSVMEPIIADYERQHPNIKIVYKMQSSKNFRTRLQTAIQQKTGPDIVRIHNTWLPMLINYLVPAPNNLLTQQDLNDFYPVFRRDFIFQNQVYALPLMIDGLALYYNVDIFQQAHLQPPTDWNELRKLAYNLTVRDPKTHAIKRAGVALGTTDNIPHWSDILGLLMLQNSANPGKPDTQQVYDALVFYTIFSTKDKVWDVSQPNSIYAFASGSVAMILAPSWQAAQIKQLNPNLDFKVIPTPTLPDTNIAWATYWAEAVTKASQHPQEAWQFLKYLSSPEVLQKLYQQESLLRGYGEPYPRQSMASLLEKDPINAAFVQQGPYYHSWYLADLTHDDGLNDQLLKYYRDAINAINKGQSVNSVVSTLSQGVAQVLHKYSITP